MKNLMFLVLITLISGCSANKIWFGSDVARLSYVKINGIIDSNGKYKGMKLTSAEGSEDESESETDDKHIGALIAWSPEFNAAFISSGGQGCIQPATYSKTNTGSAELPAEIISSGVSSGTAKVDFSQALQKLITVTDQSTFLSIGIFGLCQLHANGGLTDIQLAQLTKELFEKASKERGTDQSTQPTQTNTSTSVTEVPSANKPQTH